MKFHVMMATFKDKRWKTDAFGCQIVSILQTEDRGDAKFLSQPGNIFDPRVFTNKKLRKDLADLRPPGAVLIVVVRKRIIKVSHAGKVKKAIASVKVESLAPPPDFYTDGLVDKTVPRLASPRAFPLSRGG
jgi:hypothetical protein